MAAREAKQPRTQAKAIVYRRRIMWGDCDTAKIVFTPNFLDFALEAAEFWMTKTLGVTSFSLNRAGMGSPIVSTTFDFVSPARADDTLKIATRIAEVGRSKLIFRLTGKVGRRVIFHARLVRVLIDETRFKATPWTPAMLRRMTPWLPPKRRSAADAR